MNLEDRHTHGDAICCPGMVEVVYRSPARTSGEAKDQNSTLRPVATLRPNYWCVLAV